MLSDDLVLARHGLDRDAARRGEEGLIERLRADSSTRILVLSEAKALRAQQFEGSPAALAWLHPDEVPDATHWIYLGKVPESHPAEGGARAHDEAGHSMPAEQTPALLAAVLTPQQAETLQPEALRWEGLRTVAAQFSDADAALFTEAVSLANWHDSHQFCPRCGSATDVVQAGWVRRCPAENTDVFPRTDAAVIVRITDADDRLLLGSNAVWELNRYSLLAGFVEPGESLEAAAIREVFEESGLRIVEPRYLASQPWPFPASLMVGFEAKLAHDQAPHETKPDGEEILDVRWFTRAELRDNSGEYLLPGHISIAGAIIRDWLDADADAVADADAGAGDAGSSRRTDAGSAA